MYNADRPPVEYRGLLAGVTSGPENVQKRLREHLKRMLINEWTRLDAIADISGIKESAPLDLATSSNLRNLLLIRDPWGRNAKAASGDFAIGCGIYFQCVAERGKMNRQQKGH